MIDVLLPSRGRPALLRRSIASLRDLADQPDRVAVHIAADDDDLETLEEARTQDPWTILVSERHGYAGLHHYFNDLAEASSGEWLLLWNDDAVMQTQGWDTIIEALPVSTLVADLQSHCTPDMVCFPAVRRKAVNALGAFCLGNPHCDSFWQEIGYTLGAVTRVPVHVHHDRFNLTGNNNDQTWQDSQNDDSGHSAAYMSPENQALRRECIEKIREIRS